MFLGYLSVGMDDGYQLCNCSGSHGQEDLYPHSLYNVSCSGDNQGESANACRDGRCTWHNQSDGTPMIDTLKFPDLKGLVAYGHSLALQVGFCGSPAAMPANPSHTTPHRLPLEPFRGCASLLRSDILAAVMTRSQQLHLHGEGPHLL